MISLQKLCAFSSPNIIKFYCRNNNFFSNRVKLHQIKKAILLSSTECHGYLPLEFAREEICHFLTLSNVNEVLFIPYAKNNYVTSTLKMQHALKQWGLKIIGIHQFQGQELHVLNEAKAVFVGGGNTFLLLKRLYDKQMIDLIRDKVNNGSLVYIGSSAGTNVATKNIHTTNDMPIIYPSTFDGIGIVPFNINPHYINAHADDITYQGETRDQRILEYLEMPYSSPVLGLREGSMLKILGTSMMIKGVAGAVLFRKNEVKTELPVGSEVSFLNYEPKTEEKGGT